MVRQSFAAVKAGGAPGALDWVGAPRSVSLSLATQSESKTLRRSAGCAQKLAKGTKNPKTTCRLWMRHDPDIKIGMHSNGKILQNWETLSFFAKLQSFGAQQQNRPTQQRRQQPGSSSQNQTKPSPSESKGT